jgi:hypothetical protein
MSSTSTRTLDLYASRDEVGLRSFREGLPFFVGVFECSCIRGELTQPIPLIL